MAFEVHDPDRSLSPRTGMGRRHWVDAARLLFQGVLQHVSGPDQPIMMPGEAPPTEDGPLNLEALGRVFMLAAPLIAEDASIEVAGLHLRDYFAGQILSALDPRSPRTVGRFSDETKRRNRPTCGHTVEGAALCVGMWVAGDALWERFTRAEHGLILDWLVDVAHGRTNSHNWRWFNVLIGAPAASKGREIRIG